MTIERVLVVEDNELGREFVTESLKELGLEPLAADNGRQATALLSKEPVDLVISDLRMAELDGIGLLRWIHKHLPELPVVLMTNYGTVDTAVEALREGAEDILLKPFGPDQLTLLLERLARRGQLISENEYLRTVIEEDSHSTEIVGDSAAIHDVLTCIRRVASGNATVFIRGESGTGKELVGRTLHQMSPRRDQPFVRVNCTAFSETQLETELFGHERGVFTGAMHRREGRFELANGGTLMLAEVTEMSPRLQARLLRVLDEEVCERVGGSKAIKADVRVVATSSKNIEEAVQDGSFREDLFYRLHAIPIHMPPLRERPGDIPQLALHFLRRFANRTGKKITSFSPAVLECLTQYHWPVNVRELAQVIQRAVEISTSEVLDVDVISIPEPVQAATIAGAVGRKVEDVERDLILRTLTSTDGNRTRAAEILGVTPRTICNKIRLYRSQGHEIPEPRRTSRRKVREVVMTGVSGEM